ncbi:FxsA family protein [Saccharopolyspora gloriosae]|uniref:FxsA family protein n=1 Tax=Saccharopolyspora gloriosae TaxID=455344 RepID=UPI001FB6D92B|nr:FxsA family protein [Saccharopolyspora gloriosae]
MPILLLLLAIGVVEISVLVLVGNAVGVLPTIGLLIAAAALGSWLLRREGRRAFEAFNEAARLRRPPEREVADGVLIVGGGLLIVLPGFVSDVFGLLCLLPPTRAFLRRRLQRSAERRAEQMQQRMSANPGWAGGMPGARFPGAGRPGAGHRDDGDVIDGEVVSVSEDDIPRQHPSLDASTQAERPDGGAPR